MSDWKSGVGHPYWDAHACVPLLSEPSLQVLERHRRAGCRVVGVNVGFDGMSPTSTRASLARLANELRHSKFLRRLDEEGRCTDLAVYFDIEGSDVLEGDVEMLAELAQLGLRSLTPVYNRANRAGSGCHDENDGGLTAFGRRLVKRQNACGIIVDASHCSLRTSIELCEESEKPVIFSHSNCRALVDHPRNVTDDQLRAVAATDGVVGICGASAFLGGDEFVTEICRHVLYAISVVGVRHVGIGLDYVYDRDDVAKLVAHAPGLFPPEADYGGIAFAPPDVWSEVRVRLTEAGIDDDAVEAIGCRNFERVAARTFFE